MVGWEQAEYTICEGVPTLTACVIITGESVDGALLTLATGTSGTATGMIVIPFLSFSHVCLYLLFLFSGGRLSAN